MPASGQLLWSPNVNLIALDRIPSNYSEEKLYANYMISSFFGPPRLNGVVSVPFHMHAHARFSIGPKWHICYIYAWLCCVWMGHHACIIDKFTSLTSTLIPPAQWKNYSVYTPARFDSDAMIFAAFLESNGKATNVTNQLQAEFWGVQALTQVIPFLGG